MAIQQKRLVISRHGECPQKPEGGSVDQLTDAGVRSLYSIGKEQLAAFVQENGVTPHTTFLRHSDKVRTHDTGMGLIAGAFGVPMPQTSDELRDILLDGLNIEEDLRLGYGDLTFNLDAMRPIPEGLGTEGYAKSWTANPYATRMNGEVITPFGHVYWTKARPHLVDALGNLMSDDAKLGVTVSHGGGCVDAVAMAAVGTPHLDDIGGPFQMAGNAHLVLDHNTRSGTYSNARLERNGQRYNVDLQGLMN